MSTKQKINYVNEVATIYKQLLQYNYKVKDKEVISEVETKLKLNKKMALIYLRRAKEELNKREVHFDKLFEIK